MKADKATVIQLLKTARGQIDGIIRMAEEDRYCVDISHQLMAAEAMIKKVNAEVLKSHIKNCVKNAETDLEKEKRIDELIEILMRIAK